MDAGLIKLNPELLALFAAGGADEGMQPFKNEIFLQNITIAGTGYCDEIDEIFKKLELNMTLRMQRDPKNEHDELAIGIYYDKTRIGWVPRKQNEVVAHLMDAGKDICVRVKALQEDADQWKRIECEMLMID